MKEARLVFKCRLCGAEFWDGQCMDVDLAHLYLARRDPKVVPTHICAAADAMPGDVVRGVNRGQQGTSDLVGFITVDTEE